MTPDQLFSISNLVAMGGWILLVIAPNWAYTQKIILNGIIILLSLLYAILIVGHFGEPKGGGYNTLEQVSNLFQNRWLLLAGWVHYLAFDLITGLFIVHNARLNGVNRWIIIPCLLLTFLFGPCGLLLYLIIRFIKTRNYFASNF